MSRNVDIVAVSEGIEIAMIHDIRFKGKRKINWEEVELYLRRYVGECYEIAETGEIIYIGTDFPDEYSNSNYTYRLKGASAKAKANAVAGLPEMIRIASGKQFRENRKNKHSRDAKYGWYRYESRFALPVLGQCGEIERYNVFRVWMLMRHAKDGRLYLYDIMELKKETRSLFQSEDLTQ